jgi:hypothetical protein
MNFFVYSRDVAGTALRDDSALLEEHWSYMDAFGESMIARGPTLAEDRRTATGSLHVLDLPSVDAVREFVAREPNNCAGVYADHFVRRFEDLLGRTMWAYPGVADEPRFLVIARSYRDEGTDRRSRTIRRQRLPPELRERLILHGALSTLEDDEPVGVALAVQAPGRDAVESLLEDGRIGPDDFGDVEIHNWEFGGRR